MLHRVEVEIERGVVLVEVADFAAGCQVHLAVGQLLVAVDEFEQRGFPLTVAAHDADAVALADFQILVVEDLPVQPLKGLRAAFDVEHVHAGLVGGFEGEDERLALLGDAGFERLQFLLHALDHLVLGRDGFVVLVGPLHLLHGAHRGLNLLLNVGNRFAQRLLAGFLLHEELAVVALPRPRTQVIDLHDAVADLVEEVAVVGDDELGAFEFGQEGFEPLGRVDVQVVGRFVKEDDVDAVEADELAGEGEFGLLAARELVHGHVHRVLVEAEALKDALGDAGDVAPAARGQGLLEFRIAFHDGLPVALVEGRVHHLGFNGGDLFLEFLKLTAFAAEFFFDGRIRFEVPNLRQVSEANTGSKLNVAGVLLLLADGVEQGCFPRTVVANDADAVAVVHLDVDVTKHIHGAKGAVNRFHVDEFACHEGPSIRAPPLTVDKSRSLRRRERAGPTGRSGGPAGDGFLR